ncbi:hypothetical protein [Pseudomonas sp. Irchel 3E13]|uniref:hypothetical protein n=1 Tax=Pseudomonas sp. Irchel 3E13 TaxID=2008975 RepID=UPI000BA4A891|nr:hypothetical protein [Pseudomonas sp. Irchel 3E13]
MLITQNLQSLYTSAEAHGITVPGSLKRLPDALHEFLNRAVDLINSADATGCCGESTVVDAEKVQALSELANAFRDDWATANPPSVEVSLSIFDRHGDPYAQRSLPLAAAAVSDIVDHATQAVLLSRSGQPMGSVLDDLESALVTYDVIPEEGEVPLTGCTVEVLIEIESLDIQDGPQYGGAVLASGKRVLVDRGQLPGAPVRLMHVAHPDARKYGIPDEATYDGAERLLRDLKLVPENLKLETRDLQDDSGGEITLSVKLPACAIYIGDLSVVRKYAATHWDLRFHAHSAAEQSEIVDRFVRTACAPQ